MITTVPQCKRTFPAHTGQIALLLHAHLPYVRHPDRSGTLEERWYFEAVMETYLPLLDRFRRLERDGVPFRLTISLSPTLLAMMDDRRLHERFEAHLAQSIRLASSELDRLTEEGALRQAAAMYLERWRRYQALYRDWGGRLIDGFRHYMERGHLECITSAATHAFLPYVKQEKLVRAQLEAGLQEAERHLGRRPAGLWLPECAYSPALAPQLQACGIRYVAVAYDTWSKAHPAPSSLPYAPVMTTGGIAAFAGDPESSRQVWSSREGYPGDADYREYYRDIGFDLGWHNEAEWNYIRPYLLEDGSRLNTGLKYYRITGAQAAKAPYCPEQALTKAQEHARHFLDCRERQLREARAVMERLPVAVCPYDAELFGHWWYEGPLWLEALFRELHDRQSRQTSGLAFVTLGEALAEGELPPSPEASLPFGSWGRGGYGEVWLQERNDWIYPLLHEAEDRLVQAAERLGKQADPRPVLDGMMNRALKEWMLAASSDWAFIMDAGTVVEYAAARTREHLRRCRILLDGVMAGQEEAELLRQWEADYPCFPALDYRTLLGGDEGGSALEQRFIRMTGPAPATRVLMLAWEFPPLVVGGLSRAVYDLSRHLARGDCEVHVLTRDVPGSPAYERMDGVHVHRVAMLAPLTPPAFMDWVFQMNSALSDGADALVREGLRFDYMHAHDWLVYPAAHDLKETYGWPLISTIHATEYGRNHGRIESGLQRRIHGMEQRLAAESDHVIVCSSAMQDEVERIFALPRCRISMIPNGVAMAEEDSEAPEAQARQMKRTASPPAHESEAYGPMLFYVGRLVYEKGVHVLIDAMLQIRQAVPGAKLLIAGTGPMKQELAARIEARGLGGQVRLLGFVDDETRDAYIRAARVCVFPSLYEPFGIVALEAMRFGTPVVVSDTGGLAEIIRHGVDGYKALPGHVESLAWHVTDLLLHPEQASRMAAEAVRTVRRHYDWRAIAASTREVYEGVSP
ncbi:1,4-alpha-glucan branching protein domain-containing protein [Paenibacillus dendritiformis]|uniref:1,4-alpha-glucan branching protein domain-containing protein n=1 Tax=Paenibacillus dendritiformis TaxID=130049 RepID=UPI00387E08C7